MKKLTAVALLIGSFISGKTQPAHPSYPSLLWEISGNGMTKPSYLFGSMHVSNKMAFHLSDSFYTAIASCDMVSLEVDPKEWQPDMFRLDQAKTRMADYTLQADNEYMAETDFRFRNYRDALRLALREEPFEMNGLLYRTNVSQANFQENTYLDLYIYQTARKLGKTATGVENYLETERLSEKSSLASLKEKRQRRIFPDGENEGTLLNKLQEAYRRGDLNLLDSLNEMLSTSKAFNEIFMYPRNEIQAGAIDSIIRHRSLFVAVGAAHLPGSQGVIERLRRKGYTLRPVKMTDEDAHNREAIDKMHVPVNGRTVTTADGFIQCRLPGPWFLRNESPFSESWQYADMENGSYYMLTRVQTHAAMGGESSSLIKMRIDSLFYDNIPGKILQKTAIELNGYPGFEILNKTRGGDQQRYRILITPSEILLFKMSGTEDYVAGPEGDRFFNSIQLMAPASRPDPASHNNLASPSKQPSGQWVRYSPAAGGFSAAFPQPPLVSIHKIDLQDRLATWQYEASTPTGETYLLLKKNIINVHFLEEDTLDLSLMEESLKGSVSIDHEISRKFGKLDGYDCLDLLFSRKDGGQVRARAVIRATDYFLLVASAKEEKDLPSIKASKAPKSSKSGKAANEDNTDFKSFFDGFHLAEYRYGAPEWYTDTTRHFKVLTPVRPQIAKDLQPLANGIDQYTSILHENGVYNFTPYSQYANFGDDSTGESIQVEVISIPLFAYWKDSVKFWENEMHWTKLKGDLILAKKEYFQHGDSLFGYRYTLLDTNTNRKIEGLAEVNNDRIFKITTITDQLREESSFIRDFFSSFTPVSSAGGTSVFTSKSSLFFRQYFSDDSLVRKRAREAAGHINLEVKDLPQLEATIARLDPHSNTYLEEKTRLILALGRITRAGPSHTDSNGAAPNRTHNMDSVVGYLQRIYDQSEDTSAFQNAVIQSVARIKKKTSYALLKNWLLQATPVFENNGELQDLFRHIGDDTTLTASLFPDLLRLTSVEDYKSPVINLLIRLADSGHIRKEAYADYFAGLFVDARILLKKQQMTDSRKKPEDEEERLMSRYTSDQPWELESASSLRFNVRAGNGRLDGYAVLLLPFYDRPSVPRFFEQLLQTKSTRLRMETALLMIRGGKPVPDSVLESLAADDESRADLFAGLNKAGRPDLFPAKYKNQEAMARAGFVNSSRYEKPVTIVAAGKKWVSTPTVKGYAWFFKYKLKDEKSWLMAISGIQPEKTGEVSANRFLVTMTNRKLTDDSPEQEQFEKRLQQLVLSKRRSAAHFFQASTGLR